MKILLITEIYPSPTHGTVNETRICHYFATEWAKLGHEVRVIHFNPLLPWYYTLVGKVLKPFVKKNWSVFFKNNYRHVEEYTFEGIKVFYIPVFRTEQGKPIESCEYDKAFNKAKEQLGDYKPDIIVGHWGSMAPLLVRFRKLYQTVKTGLVLHEAVKKDEFGATLPEVGAWGFRNKAIKESFELYYGNNHSEFLCNSGIPATFISDKEKSFQNGVKNYVFVGKLMELKRVENSILALNAVYGSDGFHFEIVGDGACMDSLQEVAKKTQTEQHVTFHGWLQRDRAQQIIENSDCFIMVSDHEAFGLVYVEAMAKGCITIGTIGQGADGIIIDGENGFLCPPKDLNALISVLERIKRMDSLELEKISRNAMETAKSLTDETVACQYLDAIKNQ